MMSRSHKRFRCSNCKGEYSLILHKAGIYTRKEYKANIETILKVKLDLRDVIIENCELCGDYGVSEVRV